MTDLTKIEELSAQLRSARLDLKQANWGLEEATSAYHQAIVQKYSLDSEVVSLEHQLRGLIK